MVKMKKRTKWSDRFWNMVGAGAAITIMTLALFIVWALADSCWTAIG
jgi:hypothetical protein